MRKLSMLLVSLLVLALILAACGGDSAPSGSEEGAPVADSDAGEKVFNEVAAPACSTCHSLEPDATLVGPSLATVGSVAASRVSGVSAESYLRKSITDPDSHVVEGFAPGIMTGTDGSQLTEQQIDDLVAFMETLK